MKQSILHLIAEFFKYLLLSLASLYVSAYLILAFYRIQYPFELEWMEGCLVDHVLRILSGQKLYVRPSLEFVPFAYPPLYFYCSAALAKIFGAGFIPLRILSFVSSLGSFFVIFFIVKRETSSKFLGILACSLFAATFRLSGAWFDIARVDSLFLFLLLTVLYVVKFNVSAKSYILGGVLISLSFLTKQTAVAICLPIMLYCFLFHRRVFSFIGTIITITGVTALVLNYIHDGWYSYYIFNLPMQCHLNNYMFASFWTKDIVRPLPIASIAALLYLVAQCFNPDKKTGSFIFQH